MNALVTPFRQMMDRKLWPLAILLLAALAAVPMLLGKDEAPAVPAGTATAAAPAAAQAPTQPIVTLGQPAEREASRKVLGARKNPFEPAVKAKKESTTTTTATAAQTPVTVGGGKPSGGSAPSTPSVGTPKTPGVTPPAVTPTTPTPTVKLYDMHAAKIRFGRASDDSLRTRSPLKRLTALPRVEDPKVVFLGLKRDLKTAVFLLAADTKVVGEGACLPNRDNCQTVELKAGETEFISVVDGAGATTAQYQLDMVKVIRGVTMDPKVARRWRHTIARDGREALRANLGRVNHWKYDVKRGAVFRALND